MRHSTTVTVLKTTLLATALASAFALPASSSSHKEAPYITGAPKVDGTDFYMFRSYEANRQDYVTLLANYMPFQDPQGGPNFNQFDQNALYEIHIDNNGDAKEDITFQFRPSILVKDLAVDAGGVMVAVPLINIGQIGPNAGDTAFLNREESYAVNIIRGERRVGVSSPITNSADSSATFRKPVDNIGNKSIPQYSTYARNHIYNIAIPGCGDGRMFVGQRKDPFVVNLGETFDLVNVTNPLGAENVEKDDLADKNVTSFVVEVPIACIALTGQPVVGGWTTSSIGAGLTPTGTPGGGAAPCPAGQPASLKPADSSAVTWVPDQSCQDGCPTTTPAAVAVPLRAVRRCRRRPKARRSPGWARRS